MSSTSPIERLNYFNGQRLVAADFRVEQEYHTRLRRLLNQSLFTPGIAVGLDVSLFQPDPKLPPDPHKLVVSVGLALDSLGREIILVEPSGPVPVGGKPSEPKEPVIGNYLVIEYSEEATAYAGDGCAVRLGATCRASEDLAWGAPSRIRAEPHIYIQHAWPKTGENKIVLAQLALNKDCSVRDIRTFVRKYVASAKPAAVQAFTLEGEKDLDTDNRKELYFRVEGGVPDTAILILRGANFTTLFYSELGQHTHALNATLQPDGAIPAHAHKLGELKTSFVDPPKHLVTARVDDDDPAENSIMMQSADGPVDMVDRAGMVITHEKGHDHFISAGSVTDSAPAIPAHTHVVSSSAAKTGANIPARSGNAYTFLDELKVGFDGKNITPQVLAQLTDRDGPGVWAKLGDGTGAHTLSAMDGSGRIEGTGEIDLLRLGVDLAPGEHRLTFSVQSGGGRVQFNLFVA